MKNQKYTKKIDKIIEELEDLKLDSQRVEPTNIRVGDAGTPYSIKKVIEDEEKRTVVVVWNDGIVTKSKADPLDDFDFTTGFGLCIAKKFVYNLEDYAKAIKKSKTRYLKVKKSDSEK